MASSSILNLQFPICSFQLAVLPPSAAPWLIGLWAFVTGGVVGSFLNVVVYRLPAGKSLSRPGSHCPVCEHPIRWHDNVPIFGWIVLGGRCRDCAAGISARYPIVEALTAGLFLLVTVAEGLSGGANLPVRAVPVVDGLIFPEPGVGMLAKIVAFHLVLLSTLLAAVLIEADGHRVPLRLWGPAAAVGLLTPLAWPALRPVHAGPPLAGWPGGLLDGTAGLTAGSVVALIAFPAIQQRSRIGLMTAAAVVGLFLGWQAAAALTAIAVALYLAARALSKLALPLARVPPTAYLAVGAVVWILAWQQIVGAWPVLG